jgi:hypothetical protein
LRDFREPGVEPVDEFVGLDTGLFDEGGIVGRANPVGEQVASRMSVAGLARLRPRLLGTCSGVGGEALADGNQDGWLERGLGREGGQAEDVLEVGVFGDGLDERAVAQAQALLDEKGAEDGAEGDGGREGRNGRQAERERLEDTDNEGG